MTHSNYIYSLNILLMKYYQFLIIAALLSDSCQSQKEPAVPIINSCDDYNKEYEKLKKKVSSYSLDQLQILKLNDINTEIDEAINTLSKFDCMKTKDISFARDFQIAIDNEKKRKEKMNEAEIIEGDDILMEGVKITSYRVVYNDNVEPSIEIFIENKTKVTIKAIVFQVQYCDKKININHPGEDDAPECYENILIKGKIPPQSNGVCKCVLNADKLASPQKTRVVIFKIVRADGSLIKRLDYKGYWDKENR